jgi:2'-5' RNA ligase
VSPSRPLSLQIIGPASPDGARPRFELSGDLDVLDELFESVHKAARRTGLLVDRRNFSPHLAIAPPQYANVIPDLAGNAACRSFTSHEWSVDTIDLMRDTYDATGQPANVATIQLAISV